MKDTASANLARRPDEEHFATMADLIEDATGDKRHGDEILISDTKVVFNEDDTMNIGERECVLTPWTWHQIAGMAKTTPAFLSRLTPETRARALNESFDRKSDGHPRKWLVDDRTNAVRAVNSELYSRVWDADLFEEMDRWAIGSGWVPAFPEKNTDDKGTNINGNTKPALFRGDRDSFVFLMSNRNADDDSFGGLRRGITAWNSEVGGRGIGYTTFYFQEMCANFLIWGQTNEVVVRSAHVGSVPAWESLKEHLREISDVITTKELDNFAVADGKQFVPAAYGTDQWKEAALDRLSAPAMKKKVPLSVSRRVVNDGILDRSHNMSGTPGSFFHVANGITDAAKDIPHTDARMKILQGAGELMGAAL